MVVAVKVENVKHLCELQIHLMAIKKSGTDAQEPHGLTVLPSFFLGNADAIEQRLEMFCALPVDDAKDADELVDNVLGSGADAKLLGALRVARVDPGVCRRRKGPGGYLAYVEYASGAGSKGRRGVV